GGAPAFSSLGSDEGNHQSSIPPQVWENNAKLLEVSERLVLADLAAAGIPLAGFYVDAWTCTIYVGLTEIKDEYTEPIKAIVNEVEGVNLAFFKARFTEAELRSFQRKIGEAFWEDEALKKDETGIPFLTSIGVNIKNNELTVGLRELKPQYIEDIRKVVGTEVPIEFIEEIVQLVDKTAKYRPLIGGIQLTSLAWTGDYYAKSTSSFRATRTDGTVGMVMTGHAGWEGDDVWQPTRLWWWPWWNKVGTISVNPPTDRESDAAFFPTTDITPTIYPDRSIVSWLSSLNTPPGTLVRIEGITTCGTVGEVERTGVDVWSVVYDEVLEDQVYATNLVDSGDSGAPAFAIDGAGNATIFGTVWAKRATDVPGPVVYSPVEGVQGDLGLKWGS
ncbi:S1 family peptidase, partial [Dehalococcoidales bacterium]|nr:S1 family peptidase [Dehalococcoidales bacterium]